MFVDIGNDIKKNILDKVFPKLDVQDKTFLCDYLINLVNIIISTFGIECTQSELMEQLKQNDYRDLDCLLYMLLPHINENANTHDITKLSDIYEIKNGELFVYSNIQYSRCIRKENKQCENIKFIYEHLEHNYILLLETIRTSFYKLHVNWIDIIPYTLHNYYESNLYKNTQKYLKNNNYKYSYWNPNDNIFIQKNDKNLLNILQIDDVYNVVRNDLVASMYGINWLIEEIQGMPVIYIMERIVNDIYDLESFDLQTFEMKWKYVIHSDKGVDILKIFIYNFNKYYNNVNDAKIKGYDGINIYTLPLFYVQEYLCTCISKFKKTWYYNKIHHSLILSIKFNSTLQYPNDGPIYVSYYNVYLCMEAFVSKFVNNKYVYMDKYWNSLYKDDKNMFIDHLYKSMNNNDLSWFNTKKLYLYMRRKNMILNVANTNVIIQNIVYSVALQLVDIVFECLIYKGILSYFKPNPIITNDENISQYDKDRLKKISGILKETVFDKKNNYIYESSYNYLTGTTYKNMKNDVFIYNSKSAWYDAYALNWLSQVSFFHKYSNNRVSFVSGGTGIGKSTIIPLLYLYCLKAIDYKNNGTVLCTAPRIKPVKDSAITISNQLGVPIYDYETNEKTNNFYIQYKHQGEKHTPNDTNFKKLELCLIIVTDGLFFQNISSQKSSFLSYSSKFDIVIIDETHEHNIYMDMILTCMKPICNIHNSIKLSLVSATLDKDEPMYRRFYRDINDNLKYPLNTFIQTNKIDRINVDRRLDISMKGRTTRYKIYEEHHVDKDYKTIVAHILKHKPIGNILLFLPGKNEITKAVKTLNDGSTTPNNMIAIPFHSKLSDYALELSSKIDKRLVDINVSKQFDFEEITKDTQGTFKYDWYILVATNIAEASITIGNLNYVIDTGIQKDSMYSAEHNDSSIVSSIISESSRVQRKGRLGRTQEGTIFYLYDIKKTQNTQKIYSIVSSNMYLTIFALLSQDYTVVINTLNNPNIRVFSNHSTYLTSINNDTKLLKYIKMYYVINGMFYNYYGNDNHCDYDYKTSTFGSLIGSDILNKGFSHLDLRDMNASFYMIHPCENLIKRNMSGELLEPFDMSKMDSIWRSLKTEGYIDYSPNGDVIVTQYGKDISNVYREFTKMQKKTITISEYYIKTLLYGEYLKCENIDKIVIFVITCSGDVSNCIDDNYSNKKEKHKIHDRYKLYIGNRNRWQIGLDILKNKNNIKIWCLVNGIKYSFAKNMISNYYAFSFFYRNLKTNKHYRKVLEYLGSNIDTNTIQECDKYVYCFMMGFKYNIGKLVYSQCSSKDFSLAIGIYNLNINVMYVVDKYEPCNHNYFVYLNKDIRSNTVKYIIPIPTYLLKYLDIKDTIKKIYDEKVLELKNIKQFTDEKYNNTLLHNSASSIYNNIRAINNDFGN